MNLKFKNVIQLYHWAADNKDTLNEHSIDCNIYHSSNQKFRSLFGIKPLDKTSKKYELEKKYRSTG